MTELMALASTLWSPEQIKESATVPEAIATIMEWIETYVVRPHPTLGRIGVVCPYVPPALDLHTLWLALVPQPCSEDAEVASIILDYLALYRSLEPLSGQEVELKTLVLVFAGMSDRVAATLVPRVHKALKPQIVEAGLMLGEFYAASDSPGLHNASFRPLRSPIPLFVYRRLVPNDLLFLTKPSDSPEDRVRFLRAYLREYGHCLPEERARQAHSALSAAQAELIYS